MSITYSFFDNQLIGVDDLNKITSRILTEGVAREPSSVSALNNFVADIATAGVVPESDESLKVTATDTMIIVNNGVAIFGNGTTIEVTEPESLYYTKGDKCFVYLISDFASNRAYISVETGEPEFENKILLATVDEDGNVTDNRVYARGKLAYYGSADVNNAVYIEEYNINSSYEKDEEGYINYRVNLNSNMYRCVQILDLNDKKEPNFTRYNFADGSYISYGRDSNGIFKKYETYMGVSYYSYIVWLCAVETGEGYVNLKFKLNRNEAEFPLSLRIEFLPV